MKITVTALARRVAEAIIEKNPDIVIEMPGQMSSSTESALRCLARDIDAAGVRELVKAKDEAEEGAAHIVSSAALDELEGLLKIEGDCNADWILSEAAALIRRLQTENVRLSMTGATI